MAFIRGGRKQVSPEKKVAVRYKKVRYQDIDQMTPYEKWRVFIAWVQVVATLGVPFVVIWLNEYLKNN